MGAFAAPERLTMAWFSVWLPLVTQLVVPVSLLAWLAFGGYATTARSMAIAMLVTTYLAAIWIAGLWLVLPWWLSVVYGAVAMWAFAHRLRDRRRWTSGQRTVRGRAAAMAIGALALLLAGITGLALAGRRLPLEPVEMMFPLSGGTYLVVNGGSQALINAHVSTLDGERFAPYRGQSYGIDIVRINRVGLRVAGLLPADPAAYFIYGDPVVAPCRGRVLSAEDGAIDMPPPQVDRAHMVGNHVILECGPAWIVLGHLQRGSVAVRAGHAVETGQVLGRVGNSGNTGEPHLHVHAQRPGSTVTPLGGDPVPIRFGGRYLVRNDRVHPSRVGS